MSEIETIETVKGEVKPSAVRCPFCKSAVGEPCTRSGWADQRAACRNPHPSRVRAAALQAGFTADEAEVEADRALTGMVLSYRDKFKDDSKSYGTSMYTGIAEEVDTPIIRTGVTNIEDVESSENVVEG